MTMITKYFKLVFLSFVLLFLTGCSKPARISSTSTRRTLESYLDSVSYAMVMRISPEQQYNPHDDVMILKSLFEDNDSTRNRIDEVVNWADRDRLNQGTSLMTKEDAQKFFSIIAQSMELIKFLNEQDLILKAHSSLAIQDILKIQSLPITLKLDSLSNLPHKPGIAPLLKKFTSQDGSDIIKPSSIAPWILRGNRTMVYGERNLMDSFDEPMQILLFPNKLMINRVHKTNSGNSGDKYIFIINGIRSESASPDFCSLTGEEFTKFIKDASRSVLNIQVLDKNNSLIDRICLEGEERTISTLYRILNQN